jgi:hypothetical protein
VSHRHRDGLTLSTFHGTPADEIERIGEFLIGELGYHTVIKLNPPMLGRDRVDHILREVFGAGLQISCSAGVDAHNVADCVAAGLVPLTTCTDLLRAGGYGRLSRYITNLEARMREVGARTIPKFIERTAASRVDAGLKSCATTPSGAIAAAREGALAAGAADVSSVVPRMAVPPSRSGGSSGPSRAGAWPHL